MINFALVAVWRYIAAGLTVIIIAMGGWIWAQGVQVGKARNDRDRSQNELARARVVIAEFQAAAKECSDRTRALMDESDKKAAAADEALARLRRESDRYKESDKRLALLVGRPTPSGAGCTQAIAAVRKELRK